MTAIISGLPSASFVDEGFSEFGSELSAAITEFEKEVSAKFGSVSGLDTEESGIGDTGGTGISSSFADQLAAQRKAFNAMMDQVYGGIPGADFDV